MRMVEKYPSKSAAEERAAFLRAHGIATHVTDTSSLLRTAITRQDRSRAALWVVLDPQYDDAVALLENPEHEPSHALPPEDLEQLETQGAVEAQRLLFRAVMVLVGGLLALVALLYWGGVI